MVTLKIVRHHPDLTYIFTIRALC